MTETKFELRELKSSDLFPMFSILSKIGFKDLKESFSAEKLKEIMESFKGDEDDQDGKTTYIGFSVIIEVAEIIVKNLPLCEKEIYTFLAGLSGMTVKELADLDMVTFTEMIIAVIQKDEFKDFFKVVSRLFN